MIVVKEQLYQARIFNAASFLTNFEHKNIIKTNLN